MHPTMAVLAALAALALCASAEQVQGSCKLYNCSYEFEPMHTCQCYSGCIRYNTCCSDYKTVCTKPPPSPPPSPPPGKPGHILWESLEYGAGTSGHGLDSEAPAIFNNSVYFMSALQLWTVFSLNAKTGALEWSLTVPNASAASAPAVANGSVFYALAPAAVSDYGELVAGAPVLRSLDAATGATKWQIQLPVAEIADRPVVDNGTVYIILTASGRASSSSASSAVRRARSAPQDTVTPPANTAGAPPVNGSCQVYGCNIPYNTTHTCQCNAECRAYHNCCSDYCTFCPTPPAPSPPPPPPPRTFFAFDAETGRLRWSTNCSASLSAPAVAGGLVYVTASDNGIYAYNTTNGLLVWKAPEVSNEWSTPVVANGLLFTSESNGRLHALDAKTGKIVWNTTFEGYNAMAPAVNEELLFLSGAFDTLYAFNQKTGKQVWNVTRLCSNHLWSTPALDDKGVVYVGADDGVLHAIEAASGRQLWNFTAPTSVRSPTVQDGIVYFGTNSQMSPGSEDQLFALET